MQISLRCSCTLVARCLTRLRLALFLVQGVVEALRPVRIWGIVGDSIVYQSGDVYCVKELVEIVQDYCTVFVAPVCYFSVQVSKKG